MSNRLFRPDGGRQTHEWLLQHGYKGDKTENEKRFKLVGIAGYGHLDNFIGKHAARDVFGTLNSVLDDMALVAQLRQSLNRNRDRWLDQMRLDHRVAGLVQRRSLTGQRRGLRLSA